MKIMIFNWIGSRAVMLGLMVTPVCSCEKNETPLCPALISPVNNAMLDNGCYDQQELMRWYFEWEACPGATAYNLVVAGNPDIPYINMETAETQYTDSTTNYVADENRLDWTWKVRPYIGGEWRDWSEIRKFDVESLDTDCAQ